MFAKIQQFYKSQIFRNFDQGHVCVIKGQIDFEYNHLGIKCFNHFISKDKQGALARAIKANHIKHEKDIEYLRQII